MMKYMQDDGGRALSRRSRQSNDCVVKAIAIVTGLKYDYVYDELAGQGRVCGAGTYAEQWQPVLERLGFTKLSPNRSIKDVVENLRDNPAVLRIPRHCFAVVAGVIHDESMWPATQTVQEAWVWLAPLSVEERQKRLKHVRIYE